MFAEERGEGISLTEDAHHNEKHGHPDETSEEFNYTS